MESSSVSLCGHMKVNPLQELFLDCDDLIQKLVLESLYKFIQESILFMIRVGSYLYLFFSRHVALDLSTWQLCKPKEQK